MKNEILDILNQMNSYIYITDPQTDEIIFMNEKMRAVCPTKENPIGMLCWQALQEGMNKRCSFCKIPVLLAPDAPKVIHWREDNSKLQEVFDNYDTLITIDGKTYHMQESYEITNYLRLHEQATIDEISGVFTRVAGKEMLFQTLAKKLEHLHIVLIDIDDLRSVNDTYGRSEGDFLLRSIAAVFLNLLHDDEFIFRYSGDEFVLVLNRRATQIDELLNEAKKHLQSLYKFNNKPFHNDFTYGVVTVDANTDLDLNHLLTLADERMYKKKLRYRRTHYEEIKDHVMATQYDFDYYFDTHINQLFEAISASTNDFIYVSNMENGYFRYTPAQVAYFQMPNELMYHPLGFWKTIVHPDDWDHFYRSNMEISDGKIDYHSVEFRARNYEGEYVWLKCRGRVIQSNANSDPLFAGVMTIMGRQNRIDPLTQLPNQIQFLDVLQRKLKNTTVQSLDLLIVDIDNFKSLNSLYTRDFGDYILKNVANLFQNCLPANAGIFRLEKDVFALIIQNSTKQDIQKLFDDLCEELVKSYIDKQLPVNLTISAGYSSYPAHSSDATLLRHYAELALQQAKNSGKHQLCEFNDNLMSEKENSLRMTKQLKDSITNDFRGFYLNYQPQIDAVSQKLIGVEVLLRWKDENDQVISPMVFVPLLEEYNLIQETTLWILKTALSQAHTWIAIDPHFSISINISVLHLLEDNFFANLISIIKETSFPVENLVLEITESTTAKNIHILENRLQQLQKEGLKIALDDFGTGYSSLNILKNAPINIVKIDKSFVKSLGKDDFDYTFLRFVTSISHHAHKKVCLEGIETMDQYNLVSSLKLDYIQGYLFGKPQSAQAITEQMKGRNS